MTRRTDRQTGQVGAEATWPKHKPEKTTSIPEKLASLNRWLYTTAVVEPQ